MLYQIDSCVATSTTAEKLGFARTGCFFVRHADGIAPISQGFATHAEAVTWCYANGIAPLPHWSHPNPAGWESLDGISRN